MKTLGRILIILAVFAIVMGVNYLAVNASSSSSTAGPRFERGTEGFLPIGTERPEFRGEGQGVGWIFGAVKNIGIVAIIVMIIAWPKSLRRKRKRVGQS